MNCLIRTSYDFSFHALRESLEIFITFVKIDHLKNIYLTGFFYKDRTNEFIPSPSHRELYVHISDYEKKYIFYSGKVQVLEEPLSEIDFM